MENKNGAEVKSEEVKTTYTAEEYSKLKEVESNKTKALEEERNLRKLESEELAKYREAENKRIEDEKKSKGKYLELIESKDKEILSLKEWFDNWNKYLSEKEVSLKSEFEDLSTKINPEVLEKNKFILEDLSLDKKVGFLKNLQELTKPSDFWKNPKAGEKINWWDVNLEYEKARASWDILWMLKYKK